jgi:calcineurin-like phosphoesterase family protein
MSDCFFTADEHYGHMNIIKFCSRPFKTTEEHIEYSISEHNKIVPRGARVYHIGDIFWRTLQEKTAHEIMDRLNGQHYFIWGNHDELLEKSYDLRRRFVWCKDIAQVYHQKVDEAARPLSLRDACLEE